MNFFCRHYYSFTSSAGIGPFISVFLRYETVDNNRKERKSCRMYIIVMKQIDSFKHCSCHMCLFKDIKDYGGLSDFLKARMPWNSENLILFC